MNAAATMLIERDFDGFIAACGADSGLPLNAEVLDVLDVLVERDPATFERLRARLKTEAKVRVAVLDMALKAKRTTNGTGRGATDRG